MSRGFTVCQYVDDNGTPWRLLVDADYAADPDRGWVAGVEPGLYPLPRGWDPRQVVGIADDGRCGRPKRAAASRLRLAHSFPPR